MITNESTEIAHTVKTASNTRRPIYPSIGDPRASRKSPTRSLLLLPVERDRPRDRRRLAVRAVVLARWGVPQVVLDDPDAHGRRPHPDHSDGVDFLGCDLPDLLAKLDALLLGHAERPAPLVHQFLHASGRLLPLSASRIEPLRVKR